MTSPSGSKTFCIPGATEQIQAAAGQLVELYAQLGISREKISSLRLAFDEAVMNAVKHGHCGDCSLEICITCEWTPRSVTLIVKDQGNGYNPTCVLDPTRPANILKESGRGLYILTSIMSEISFNDKRNEIRMMLRTDSECP